MRIAEILNCKICRHEFFASSLSHQNQTNASQPGVQRVTRARQIAIFSEINFFVLSVQLTFRRAMSEDAARGGEKYEPTIRNFFITRSRPAAHSCSRYFSARILIKKLHDCRAQLFLSQFPFVPHYNIWNKYCNLNTLNENMSRGMNHPRKKLFFIGTNKSAVCASRLCCDVPFQVMLQAIL